MSAMNGNEMRRVLSDEIYKLRSGKSKPDRVNAISRAASTICASIRIELQFCNMTGQTPNIPFIGTGGKKIAKPSAKKGAAANLKVISR